MSAFLVLGPRDIFTAASLTQPAPAADVAIAIGDTFARVTPDPGEVWEVTRQSLGDRWELRYGGDVLHMRGESLRDMSRWCRTRAL